MKRKVIHGVDGQQEMHKQVQDTIKQNREKQRGHAINSRGELPFLAVGDYLLRVWVRRSGSTSKLMVTWTGPWKEVETKGGHVYGVQNITSGEVHGVNVARLRFYSDSELEITSELKHAFQYAYTQGEFIMSAIVGIGEN